MREASAFIDEGAPNKGDEGLFEMHRDAARLRNGFSVLLFALLVFSVGCAQIAKQPPSQPDKPTAVTRPSTSTIEIPPALAQKVRTAEDVGQYLALQDVVATKGNDVVQTDPTLRDDPQRQGWIIVQDDRCMLVRFFGQLGDQYASLYDICFRLNSMKAQQWTSELIKHETPLPLPAAQQNMVRARQLAVGSLTEPCSDQYRLVMLPGNMDNQKFWAVYLIPSSKKPETVIVRGHAIIAVSGDGTQVLRSSQPSKCLELPTAPAVPLTFGELVSETPTEFHIYLNRMLNSPIYVSTRAGLWKVNEGRLALIEGRVEGQDLTAERSAQ